MGEPAVQADETPDLMMLQSFSNIILKRDRSHGFDAIFAIYLGVPQVRALVDWRALTSNQFCHSFTVNK